MCLHYFLIFEKHRQKIFFGLQNEFFEAPN
nr:MAG TPA: hypothetical protein [Bacteriophage sp.]